MTISNDIITFFGIMFTFSSALVGVVRWVINNHNRISEKIDEKATEVERRSQERHDEVERRVIERHDDYNDSLTNVHKRIDDVKDTYVKRVDLDRDLINIMTILNSMEAAQRDQTKEMNARLDRLIGIFADRLEK